MTDKFELIRLESNEAGTFGALCHGGQVFCLTLEPPDRNNAPDISCIPAGRYNCRRVRSPRFGPTFEVTGVPGRTHILFHQGNVAADTNGCVLLGSRYGALGRVRGVLDSGAAFGAFMARCDGLDGFELTISRTQGEG
ncbi:MAG: hypothetical protein KUA35_01210 [Pseudodesulfovibrio sp.]|uniref:DUF5675 domain-containing protein n=1 Tax=Pseudodesulfovibrio aespoeensis (strain ATCC 700646 / DSM 10631 / Aspo-2) TaxID=643562 RepID=E6VV88_PSEA9|nr:MULTISPECIES: DUF5675 family protein [Pseudodesulfovibrio]MBU4192282.1 hypothetical protein [Pseudomonadota bacterium]MCG2733485.1 DUF5675 family protein [Pseudodesulfovibrio aespoeensis]ADU61239.1 hypothetical protein Daes_0212 [Pseudodesulfovibrio aespoeensis Aspo-2]MBU4245107.1 hypothetical protein [Pseudomonadota bacterium]MBU4378974.1 hypothetical protein [Pseudomonadota bacterium]